MDFKTMFLVVFLALACAMTVTASTHNAYYLNEGEGASHICARVLHDGNAYRNYVFVGETTGRIFSEKLANWKTMWSEKYRMIPLGSYRPLEQTVSASPASNTATALQNISGDCVFSQTFGGRYARFLSSPNGNKGQYTLPQSTRDTANYANTGTQNTDNRTWILWSLAIVAFCGMTTLGYLAYLYNNLPATFIPAPRLGQEKSTPLTWHKNTNLRNTAQLISHTLTGIADVPFVISPYCEPQLASITTQFAIRFSVTDGERAERLAEMAVIIAREQGHEARITVSKIRIRTGFPSHAVTIGVWQKAAQDNITSINRQASA